MLRFQYRGRPSLVLALAIGLLGWILSTSRAEEQAPQAKSEEPPAKEATADKEAAGGGTSARGQTFDPAVVSAGMAAFAQSCTKCHDAARSLDRSKDLAGWRATVRRMA